MVEEVKLQSGQGRQVEGGTGTAAATDKEMDWKRTNSSD